MSKINKIKVENTTYDVEDREVKSWARANNKPTYDYSEIQNTPNLSNFITKDVNDLTNYELKTATGNSIEMSIDSTTYVMTLSLKNSQGTILNTQTVDLPLETMVVGGTYDSTNKKIVLTLKNGNTIDVPVGDLINGLQSEITSTNKLDASLVDDSLSNNKFVTTSEKTTWNNKSDFSGNYNDLTNKPIIPDVSTKEDKSNKVTTIDNTSTNTQYASAKAIYDLLSGLSGAKLIPLTGAFGYSEITPIVFENLEKGLYYYQDSTGSASSLKRVYLKTTSTGTVTNFYGNLFFIFMEKTIAEIEDGEKFAVMYIIDGSTGDITINKLATAYSKSRLTMNNESPGYKVLTSNEQTIIGVKKYAAYPEIQTYVGNPSSAYQFAPKKYVDDKPTTYTGYDSTKTQVLKNVNGTLTWVDE